ncbi:WD40 repeat-like protein [Exidia glandulosa HHB12029]|uniref:Pre-rRNA-processing protein IPI3 n=1 Tax=Exidia glandulosa HHB12029 TaxID=1314781 RepID=A0A165IA01_EXIGL|nr:WD40 repeat-like protein [Exidia glandulosa HHB12029]
MHPQAVLVVAQPAISLLDYTTGTLLASWKPANSNARCTALVATHNGLGGVMLAVQPDKPLLHAFAFQKDQMLHKIVLPEKLSALALDNAASYCAGGTHTGRVYLWEVASGLLLNTFDAHYRQITVLRFSPDGAALFSASEDSGIAVWSMSRLLDNNLQNDLPTPYWSLADHTLAVTDVQCGVGVFPSYRVFSSSLDGSVKVWDIASRELLGTFSFPTPIGHLVVDPSERAVYAAASGDRGVVYQCDLYSRGPGHHTARALVGAGETLHMAAEEQSERQRSFNVGKPVMSLALDLPGTQLLAGTTDGTVSIFDVASHQLLRTISPSAQASPGPVTFVTTMLRPSDLVGPASAQRDTLPLRPLAVFQRIRDKTARETHDVPLVLPKSALPPPGYSSTSMLRDHAAFLQQGQRQEEDASALAAEVARLKEQLAQAKGINDSMWEAAVHAALVPADGQATPKEKSSKRQKVA